MSVCVFAASNSASSASSSCFRLRTGNLRTAGRRNHPTLALVCRFPSLGKRAQLLDDARYGKADDNQSRDRKTKSTMADITLPNSVKPHHAMPAPI